jgi:hypothetical protein
MGTSVQLTLTGKETKPYADKQRLRTLAEDKGMSATEIASHFECGATTVRSYLRAFGIGCDDVPGAAVSLFTDKEGYEYVRVDHHYFRCHRLLMIAEHGLDALDDNSVVHHCSGIPWDNRPNELRVFPSQRAHSRHHARPEITEDQQTLEIYPHRTHRVITLVKSHRLHHDRQRSLNFSSQSRL